MAENNLIEEELQAEMRNLDVVTDCVEIEMPVMQSLMFGEKIPDETHFIPVTRAYYKQNRGVIDYFKKQSNEDSQT